MLSSEQKNELLQVFTDLIRIDSSNPPGNETGVVESTRGDQDPGLLQRSPSA